MKEARRQAEDVAAVLQEKIKCPQCSGTGESWRWEGGVGDPDREKVPCACFVCAGKRWLDKRYFADLYATE